MPGQDGPSVWEAWTVCGYWRTVREARIPSIFSKQNIQKHLDEYGPSDQHSQTVRPERIVRHLNTDPSNPLQPKPSSSTDRTPRALEHERNTATHRPSAPLGRTVRPARRARAELGKQGSTCPIHPWISQTAARIETRFWGDVKCP
jgi:hypothetical protein